MRFSLVLTLALLFCSAGRAEEQKNPKETAKEQQQDQPNSKALTRTVLGFKDLTGQVTVDKFSYWDFPPATDLRARLKITEQGWKFENVRADYCGGKFKAEAAIDKTKTGRSLRFAAEFEGVHLDEFTRLMKRPVMPGKFNAKLKLKVSADGREGLSGKAEVHAKNASLGKLPVILKAFTFLSFPGIEKEELSEVDARATLTPRAIVFTELSLRSKSGSLVLEADRLGSVSYKGELNLRFRPVIPSKLLKSVPLVGEAADLVISGIQQGIMRIRVTGTLAEPKFKWTPFR